MWETYVKLLNAKFPERLLLGIVVLKPFLPHHRAYEYIHIYFFPLNLLLFIASTFKILKSDAQSLLAHPYFIALTIFDLNLLCQSLQKNRWGKKWAQISYKSLCALILPETFPRLLSLASLIDGNCSFVDFPFSIFINGITML